MVTHALNKYNTEQLRSLHTQIAVKHFVVLTHYVVKCITIVTEFWNTSRKFFVTVLSDKSGYQFCVCLLPHCERCHHIIPAIPLQYSYKIHEPLQLNKSGRCFRCFYCLLVALNELFLSTFSGARVTVVRGKIITCLLYTSPLIFFVQ